MVQLVSSAGGGVARCTPVEVQHATNPHSTQQATQQSGNNRAHAPSETQGSATQHIEQQPRNSHTTKHPSETDHMLRAVEGPLRANEHRHRRVVAFLADHPNVTRAIITDSETDPDHVIVTIGIRSEVVGELLIPRRVYDGMALLQVLQEYADA